MQTAIVTVTADPRPSRRPLSGPRRAPVRVPWRGAASLPECIRCLCSGEVLEIDLPSQSLDGIGLPGGGDGPALLGALSRSPGLELIGLLVLPAQVTGARARLRRGRPSRLVISPRRPPRIPGG
jgi:hypothetical protein